MNIGNLHIDGQVMLAPLAGVSDSAYRLIARKAGAAMVFSELVSADGLVRDSAKTFDLLKFEEAERPYGIQIFGTDPDVMAEGAKRAAELKPDVIDLNFGCPAKKVVKRGAGSACLKDVGNLGAIVKAVVQAVQLPVTVKIRSGWDADHIVATDVARISEDAGAQAITVHPRTQSMGFKGKADWRVIAQVVRAVQIPVIGNGDVASAEDAHDMLSQTGCCGVMIGRASFGAPWIFKQVHAFLSEGIRIPDPLATERIDQCLAHYVLALKMYGSGYAVREMRKHVGWYLKGLPGSSRVRQEIFSLDDSKQVIEVLKKYQDCLSRE